MTILFRSTLLAFLFFLVSCQGEQNQQSFESSTNGQVDNGVDQSHTPIEQNKGFDKVSIVERNGEFGEPQATSSNLISSTGAYSSIQMATERVDVSEYLNSQLLSDLPEDMNTNLFQSYNANGVSQWTDSYLNRTYDFSGVAWSHYRAGTLVGPRHIIFARHYQHPINVELTFTRPNGEPVKRTMIDKACAAVAEGGSAYDDDYCIGLLNENVPEDIKIYKIVFDGSPYNLTGAHALVTNRLRQVAIKKIFDVDRTIESVRPIARKTIIYYKSEGEYAKYDRELVSGDSGNPAFVVIEGELILYATHLTSITGPYYWSPLVVKELRRLITLLHNKHNI